VLWYISFDNNIQLESSTWTAELQYLTVDAGAAAVYRSGGNLLFIFCLFRI